VAMEPYAALVRRIGLQDQLAIAFSGGVDSTLVVRAAIDAGVDALGITIDGPLFSRYAIHQATQMAQELGIAHRLVPLNFFPDDTSPQRCYVCKTMMARNWLEAAAQHGYHCVADGVTATDLLDDRQPGAHASSHAGVWHPLAEIGITDATVRSIARNLGLSNWDAPSDACLATRIAFNEPITPEKLNMIEAAEAYIRSLLGHRLIRVRLHHTLARIELSPSDIPHLMNHRGAVTQQLQTLGFNYVTIDVQGYRSGSMHHIPRP